MSLQTTHPLVLARRVSNQCRRSHHLPFDWTVSYLLQVSNTLRKKSCVRHVETSCRVLASFRCVSSLGNLPVSGCRHNTIAVSNGLKPAKRASKRLTTTKSGSRRKVG